MPIAAARFASVHARGETRTQIADAMQQLLLALVAAALAAQMGGEVAGGDELGQRRLGEQARLLVERGAGGEEAIERLGR